MVSGRDIVVAARSFKDVPFVHQGRSLAGIDCAGLVVMCAQRLGLSTFDTSAYKRVPDGKKLLNICREQMQAIDPASMQFGDVLLFRDKEPRHLAIVGDHPFGGFSIIHACWRESKVIETVLNDKWLHQLVGAFRLPGVV